jgi:hypothetical protein
MADIYERNINIKVIPLDKENFEVNVSLLDLSHSIHATLKINIITQEIIDADAKMMRVPFSVCHLAENNIKKIRGLKVQRGINKQIAQIVGAKDGCTHLVEILQSALRFGAAMLIAKSAGYETYGEGEKLTEEERIARSMPVLKNTCVVFRENE